MCATAAVSVISRTRPGGVGPVLEQGLVERRVQQRAADRLAGQVDLELEVGVDLLDPGEQRDRLVDHPAVDVDDLAGALRDVEEALRQHQLVAVDESDQGLGAVDLAGSDVEDRLQAQRELVVLDRVVDALRPGHPGAGTGLLVLLVPDDHVLVATSLLGVVHGHVGGRDEVLERRVPVADEDDADAGGDPAQHALLRLREQPHPLQDVLARRTVLLPRRPLGRSTANSSPPSRATRSPSRRFSARSPDMAVISSSPTPWPRVSLTSLKWSRSRQQERAARAVGLAVREVPRRLGLEPVPVRESRERVVLGQVDETLAVRHLRVWSTTWETTSRPSAPWAPTAVLVRDRWQR
jgi:hypothetical protein